MNKSSDFYKWFNEISSKLGPREISFKKIFEYLDSQPSPIIIVETGCLRNKNTLSRGENSKIYTVDINPESSKICKEVVSKNVIITTDDSVRYLNNLSKTFLKNKTKVSMFYLDSFDVDWRYPYPSAAHHLKELVAINRLLNENTLVVVDDSPATGNLTQNENKSNEPWKVLGSPSPLPTIGGKGFLVHEYASHVGAKLLFSHYQTAWNKFNK